MKRFVVFFVFSLALVACEKPKVLAPTSSPDAAIADDKASKERQVEKPEFPKEKSSIEELEGKKAVKPEELSPEQIAAEAKRANEAQLAAEAQRAKEKAMQPDITVKTGPLSKVVRFELDSYEINDKGKELLREVGRYLSENKAITVTIEGNCDERGTREYNLALGMKRADSVRKYLADLGVDDARLRTTSFGKDKPLNEGHDESAWEENRRSEFKVVR